MRTTDVLLHFQGRLTNSYSSVDLSNGPRLSISVEIPGRPADLVPIAEAAKRIGVDRSWAFRVYKSGLLKTAHGARPVLISAAELASQRKRDRRRPRRTQSASRGKVAPKPDRLLDRPVRITR